MKYTFTILIDGNYYDEDEEFEKDIELSDDEIAAIKKLVDDYESDLSCGLIPILEAGSEELYHKFYDAIFPHVFFVLFQRDPCFEPEPGDEDKIWDEDEDIEYLMETYGDGYDFDDAFVVYIPDEMMPQKPTLTKSMTNEDLQEYINKWYHNIQESIFNIIRWGDYAFSNELDDDLMIIINDKLLSYLNQTIKDNNDEVIAKTDFEPFTDDIQKKIANEAFDELKEKNDPQNKKHHIMKFDKQEKQYQFPEFFKDEKLEDAFMEPATNENGECEPIPAIFNDYGYGKYDDGVLFITLKSASLISNLYSKYLDEKALVWDSNNERLLLYVPDPSQPKVAFKGSAWNFAKRLKPEYEEYINLRDMYYEYLENNKQLDSDWETEQE